jgi:hypothetical protein
VCWVNGVHGYRPETRSSGRTFFLPASRFRLRWSVMVPDRGLGVGSWLLHAPLRFRVQTGSHLTTSSVLDVTSLRAYVEGMHEEAEVYGCCLSALQLASQRL